MPYKIRFWLTLMVIGTVLAVFILAPGTFVNKRTKQNSNNSSNPPQKVLSNKTLNELLAGKVLYFPPIKSSKSISKDTLSQQLSLFFDPSAPDGQEQSVIYENDKWGFLLNYTSKVATADSLYQTHRQATQSNDWHILYGDSSNQGAVLEVEQRKEHTFQGKEYLSVYQTRIIYENQNDGKVRVNAQYLTFSEAQ